MTQEKQAPPRGFFIALEGIDGAGKTTQSHMLCKALEQRGHCTVYLKEPTDGPNGRRIRQLASAGRDSITPMEEFTLFRDDRRQDVEENIRPALKAGKVIVLDRYFYSSIAYQGALGLDMDFINRENRKIALEPDLVIYLSIPVEMTPERIETSRGDSANLFEKVDYLSKVKENFDAMTFPEIWKVDGAAGIQEVHQGILERVLRMMENREGRLNPEDAG